MNVFKRCLILLCLIIVMSSPVRAHQLWINMTDYSPKMFQHPRYAPEPRAKTTAYFGWGHAYPVADFPDEKYLENMTQVEPDGTRKAVTLGKGGFRAVEIKMTTEGPRIFEAAVIPGFYQPVKGKKDFHEMYYEMYAKALVSVGSLDGNPFKTPVGQRMEIVPQVNPYTLKPGDTLPVKVLFNGKPSEDVELKAVPMYSGTGESMDAKTDENGRASFVIDRYYGPWLLAASRKDPATPEYSDKCNTLYYCATLTFALEK